MTTIDTGYVRAANADGMMYWMGGGCWTGERSQAILLLRSDYAKALPLFAEQRERVGEEGPHSPAFIEKVVEPFHPLVHETLVEAGYSYTREPCTFEDDGDAESGPHLVGGPEFDQYEGPLHYVAVLPGGECHFEKRDLAMEAFFDGLADASPFHVNRGRE